MRDFLGSAIGNGIAFLLLANAAASQERPEQAADEAAIRAVIQKNADAWAAGSGAAFAAQFAEQADYIPPTGNRVHGRPAIARSMQQIFDTIYKGARLWVQIQDIRLVRPDVAVAHVGAAIVVPKSAPDPAKPGSIQTYVLSRHDGAWQIEAFQNTMIQRGGGPPRP
jgi:uncharacterized protein (TIGR02246 family)